ncbi:MAG: NAD(P)-dependent oxidoreductase [Deltaproteobacteria bacterium]|nr:NAD(P)-dependent oxidoreductase [Deltaproteobacteria bacterium]MBM4299189.1 NAD(P)-dependent oxidoreductase [Deltaproteobacteria bacterium]
MKIMVVGSSGYIGRHVVKGMSSQGAEVVAFDVVPAPPAWQVAGVPFIQGNMTNLEEVMAAVVDHNVRRIVALGYYMTPLLQPECRDLMNAARINIVGVTNIFEAARLAKLDRVIFASTVGIFGYQDVYGPEPIDENTEPRGTKSLYGLMKLVNNGLSERYNKTCGTRIVKVHSAAVIGPGNTAFSKRMIQDPALGKPGFGNWPSAGPRNIVGVNDIAQLYAKITLAKEVKHDTYMGTGPTPTGKELAGLVKKYLPEAEITFDEKVRIPAWRFDNSRAVKEFGWQIQSVEEMVVDEINGTRTAASLPLVS